jgi:hypothetical protein
LIALFASLVLAMGQEVQIVLPCASEREALYDAVDAGMTCRRKFDDAVLAAKRCGKEDVFERDARHELERCEIEKGIR